MLNVGLKIDLFGLKKVKKINGVLNMNIKLDPTVYIGLYSELADYVLQYSSVDPTYIKDTNGDIVYTDAKQDEFVDIVGDTGAV